jgi:hypothetical protein
MPMDAKKREQKRQTALAKLLGARRKKRWPSFSQGVFDTGSFNSLCGYRGLGVNRLRFVLVNAKNEQWTSARSQTCPGCGTVIECDDQSSHNMYERHG